MENGNKVRIRLKKDLTSLPIPPTIGEDTDPQPLPNLTFMHYKNGREAKNGDKVVLIGYNGIPVAGILYDAVAGNDYCNGRIAITTPSDPCPNLNECLRADDIAAAQVPVAVTPEPFNPVA